MCSFCVGLKKKKKKNSQSVTHAPLPSTPALSPRLLPSLPGRTTITHAVRQVVQCHDYVGQRFATRTETHRLHLNSSTALSFSCGRGRTFYIVDGARDTAEGKVVAQV